MIAATRPQAAATSSLLNTLRDSEVFLVSRIQESWIATGNPHRSVAIGIGATARVITTAAAVMVTVFTSFVLNPDPAVKMLATPPWSAWSWCPRS